MSASIKDSAVSFLQLAASGKADTAFEKFVAAGFRHHNPHFQSDAESLKQAMNENALSHPDKVFEVQRVIHEGSMVAVHSRIRMNRDHPGVAVVHIFRFEGERIAELWDIGQPVPEGSANQLGMF